LDDPGRVVDQFEAGVGDTMVTPEVRGGIFKIMAARREARGRG